MVVGVQQQQRRGTAAAWSSSGAILGAGEMGVTTDTKIIKVGDGVNEWDDLPIAFEDLYLTIGGTASDSALLGGISSSGFLKTADATTAATADKIAKRFGDGRLKAAAGVSTDDVVNYSQLTSALVSRSVSATLTLALTDVGKIIVVDNASYTPSIVLNIPTNASVPIPVGSFVDVYTSNKGPTTLTPAGGVSLWGETVLHGGGSLRLVKTSADGWMVQRIHQSSGPILRRKIKTGADNTLASGAFTRVRLNGANDAGPAGLFSNNADTLGANQQYDSAVDLYRCYCRRSGWYDTKAQVSLAESGTGRFFVQLRVNNIEQDIGAGVVLGGAAEMTAQVKCLIPLNVGDYVEVWPYQDGAGSRTVSDSTYASSFFEWEWKRSL